MTMPSLVLAIVLAAVSAWGCSSASYATAPPKQSYSPRVRCLADPNERDTRPLFHFLCIESP